jgi:hypothetical protein
MTEISAGLKPEVRTAGKEDLVVIALLVFYFTPTVGYASCSP